MNGAECLRARETGNTVTARVRRKLVIADIRTHAIIAMKCISDLANETGSTRNAHGQ